MTKCCNNGCKSCHKYSVKEIDKLIYKVSHTMSSYSEEWYNKEKYDFKSCSPYLIYLIGSSYLRVLKRHRDFIVNKNRPVLKDGKFSDFVEKILDYSKHIHSIPTRENRDNYESWALDNPKCAGYEAWEIAFRKICTSFTYEEFFHKILDPVILYDISQHDVSCEILYDIIAYNDICDIHYEITNEILCRNLSYENFVEEINCKYATKEVFETLINCSINFTQSIINKCELEYTDIITLYPKCSISFSDYLKLVDCNLSYDLILKLYSCNIEVEYDSENKCPNIKANGNIYSIKNEIFSKDNIEIFNKLIQTKIL